MRAKVGELAKEQAEQRIGATKLAQLAGIGTATVADAMYAPVCTRFATYDVKLDPASAAYRDLMMKFPAMVEWTAAARSEPEEVEELDVEF